MFKPIKTVEEWVMQQDNDPKHRAHIGTHWLKDKEIELVKWPAFCLDLNPIEHMWGEVERKRSRRTKQPLLRISHRCHKEVGRFRVE